MKICIYGAGAIGGYLGVQLARAGADVSLVARGAHLAAMRERGLTLLAGEEKHAVHPRCTDDPAELGVQDYIIITLKAHSITGVIEKMQPLLGPHTRIVTAVNGIPYWYFYKHGGQYENSTLESIDPADGSGARSAPSAPSAASSIRRRDRSAGVIRHVYGNDFPLGEPSGEITSDVQRLADLFVAAGLKAPVLDRIRDEIWLKLWGNVCFNPISALTHATLDVICTDPSTRALSRAIMVETQGIAETFGVNSASTSSAASRAPARSARTRPRCSRISSAAVRWRSTRSSPWCRRWAASPASPRPRSNSVLAMVTQRARIAGLYDGVSAPHDPRALAVA
ncbi:2-dehydropantoate 2-reductase [Bradyrhizobium japonicum]